jgi:DNA repair protein RadC
MKNKQEQKHSIRDWAIDDRPREKLLSKNPVILSNSELLALLINNGDRGKSAVDLGKDLLNRTGNNLETLAKQSVKELMKVKGIGLAKAVRIAAALELGRRIQAGNKPDKFPVKGSKDVAVYLQALFRDHLYEEFGVIYLNKAHKINCMETISKGGMTGTVADPRVILKRALEENATSLILFHNHPSGNLQPSQADKDITQKINRAATYLDIKLLDHLIVSGEGFYSFADNGLIGV